jgi:hypothetical protein
MTFSIMTYCENVNQSPFSLKSFYYAHSIRMFNLLSHVIGIVGISNWYSWYILKFYCIIFLHMLCFNFKIIYIYFIIFLFYFVFLYISLIIKTNSGVDYRWKFPILMGKLKTQIDLPFCQI